MYRLSQSVRGRTKFTRGVAQLTNDLAKLKQQRQELLRHIYEPFSKLEKDSPEYQKLAESGKVWEDYFQPGNSEQYGYVRLQHESSKILSEIDSLKERMKLPAGVVARKLIAEYSHQSVVIENNQLKLGDSVSIEKHLLSTLLNDKQALDVPISELRHQILPSSEILSKHADASQVAELRNHIVASHWITRYSMDNPGCPGISEPQLRELCALVNKETISEVLYKNAWGKKVALGEYRQLPIAVKSNPLSIFPYHIEVPALMNRLFEWRNENPYKLHPIIFACQALVYFLHIHPFLDGNGRCSRLVMQGDMIRQGFLPVVYQQLKRDDYLRMIRNATYKKPDELVQWTLKAQHDELLAHVSSV